MHFQEIPSSDQTAFKFVIYDWHIIEFPRNNKKSCTFYTLLLLARKNMSNLTD